MESKNESLYDLINKADGPTSEAFLFGTQFERDGRKLVVNLETLYNENDEDENVILKNGDRVFIPKKPNTIVVDGEVNNPGLYRFTEGLSVKDYIDNAGGITDSANYVIYRKANGESRRVDFGVFTSNPDVYDGSVLIITKEPWKEKKETTFDLGKTVIDIFALLASALTVWVLSKQL
jgi:protein involved in polysaccharide export with SLBB domain